MLTILHSSGLLMDVEVEHSKERSPNDEVSRNTTLLAGDRHLGNV